ncbi:hypothetical protein LCGC14_2988880, partial [marine sediment metagenome]
TYPRGWFDGHNVKLTFDPDASNAMSGAGGHIVMSGQAFVEDVWWMMLHEVGHLADFWCLTDSGRARVLAAVGRDIWDKPAKEFWAQSFPHAYLPPNRGYSYPQYPVSDDLIRELLDECEVTALKYPSAIWKGDGVSGGTYVGLPYRVVVHTTETGGLPGYGDGWSAPHLTYMPAIRKWVQHTDLKTAARGLRNPGGGVQTNRANALQIEIVCYSNKSLADEHSARLWVGDLTESHYADLKAFVDWTSTEFDVKPVWPGRQAFSYTESNAVGFRMTNNEWDDFTGVCGHQHVPENTHWDPGAFDWTQLLGEDMAVMPDNVQQFWVDVFDELGKLDPKTSASFAKALVEFKRDHPSTVSGITEGYADGR